MLIVMTLKVGTETTGRPRQVTNQGTSGLPISWLTTPGISGGGPNSNLEFYTLHFISRVIRCYTSYYVSEI